MSLIVFKDSRNPKMGGIDHKDRKIVIFENGGIGFLQGKENADLRGGSKYKLILNNLKDLKFPPTFLSPTSNLKLIKRIHFVASISIYFLIVVLLITFPLSSEDTWNVLISNWIGLDFNGVTGLGLAILAFTFGMSPEIVLTIFLEQRDKQSILILDGKHEKIEIIFSNMASTFELRTSKNTPYKSVFALGKGIFPMLMISDQEMAITLAILSPIIIFIYFIYSTYISKKRLNDNQIEIPEVTPFEMYNYIKNQWSSSELENYISGGETDIMEFKSSIWYDYDKAVLSKDASKQHRYDPDYIPSNKASKKERSNSVIKAVAGFLNSDKPGTLMIGVSDEGAILGLNPDFEILNVKPPKIEIDVFNLKIEELLQNNLVSRGKSHGLWEIKWLKHDELDICVIKIKNSPQAVYHKLGDEQIYYRRYTAQTVRIKSGIELEKELKKFPRLTK